jgi:hypothetical protein
MQGNGAMRHYGRMRQRAADAYVSMRRAELQIATDHTAPESRSGAARLCSSVPRLAYPEQDASARRLSVLLIVTAPVAVSNS